MKTRLKFTFGKAIRARIFTPATAAKIPVSTAYDSAQTTASGRADPDFDGYEAAMINFGMIASRVADPRTAITTIEAAAVK